MIWSFDLGTNTGYCVGVVDSGRRIAMSGVANFKPGRFEGGGMRFLRFRRWLDEALAAGKPTEVVFEEVRAHKGTDAAHVYGGLLAVLTEWCESNDIPYEGVPVGKIKSFATGKGNANKLAVIEAVTAWGFTPKDDNEADAIALWMLRAQERAPGFTA